VAVNIRSVDSVSITVDASGGPGNPRDFVGIYKPTDTIQQMKVWKYLANDRTSPRPLSGVTNGLVHLVLPTPIGQYEARFVAVNSAGNFTLVSKSSLFDFDLSPSPELATPKSVTLTPSSVSLPDTSPIDTRLCTVSVAMSDGSTFSGSLATNNSATKIVGSALQLARNLSPTDDGTANIIVTASQNGVSASSTFVLTVTSVVVVTPKTVTLSPSSVTLLDNASSGTQMSDIGVTMSDNSVFSGTLSVSPNNSFAGISGKKLVTIRNLSPTDDGSKSFTVTATQNSANASSVIQVQVNAPSSIASPDGTFSCPPSGAALVDKDKNNWTWNTPGNAVLINGVVPVGGGAASQMLIQNGGQFFVLSNAWWKWNGGANPNAGFGSSSPSVIPPRCPTPPASISMTLSPSSPTLPDNSPAGTRVCSVSVTMSDGSPFTGTLTTSDTTLFAISGSSVVTARALTSSDDGPHSTTITATQSGQAALAQVGQ
jgi:hypothetical protein